MCGEVGPLSSLSQYLIFIITIQDTHIYQVSTPSKEINPKYFTHIPIYPYTGWNLHFPHSGLLLCHHQSYVHRILRNHRYSLVSVKCGAF